MPDEGSNFLPSIVPSPSAFDALVEITIRTVSESSARVYQHTYRLWQEWTAKNDLSSFDLNGPNVVQFLIDQPVAKTSRQRMLSAMRTLAKTLADLDAQNPLREVAYRTIKRIRVPTANLVDNERPKRALSPAEVDRVFRTWDGESNADKRNRALIAVLLLTGVRRSEAAVLKWSDVDLVEGVINVRHGKGDKARDVAVYGDSALDALEAWRAAQGEGREYIFCAVNKADHLGPDEPMTATSVYRVVKQTEEQSGLKHFSPHDARRTLITELLATGTPLADAQAQAGHSQGQTTLRYAQAVDARLRRRQGRIRYG